MLVISPETEIVGKNSPIEILTFSFVAFKFSLSAFSFGLFFIAASILIIPLFYLL